MITTEGFRDIVEIRRGLKNERVSMYNVFVPPYEPLAPRYLRARRRPSGCSTRRGPDAARRGRTCARPPSGFGTKGVEPSPSASCTRTPTRPTSDGPPTICEEVFGPGRVTTSHEILPVWREFERFTTTLVCAYVGPVVGATSTDFRPPQPSRLRGRC